MMFGFGNFKALAAAAALVLTAGVDEAKAVTVDASDIGTSFFVDFNYANTLLAEFEWTLTGISGLVWSFTVAIDNNSANNGTIQNRLSSFGFSETPNVSVSVDINNNGGGLWTGVSTNPTAGYQNIAGGIEDCVRSGANNCQGSGNGVVGGGSSTLGLALTLASASSTLTFDAFAARFQSISVPDPNNPNALTTSLAFQGYERQPPMPPVPVPAAGLMLLGALGGLAALRRRRKTA